MLYVNTAANGRSTSFLCDVVIQLHDNGTLLRRFDRSTVVGVRAGHAKDAFELIVTRHFPLRLTHFAGLRVTFGILNSSSPTHKEVCPDADNGSRLAEIVGRDHCRTEGLFVCFQHPVVGYLIVLDMLGSWILS